MYSTTRLWIHNARLGLRYTFLLNSSFSVGFKSLVWVFPVLDKTYPNVLQLVQVPFVKNMTSSRSRRLVRCKVLRCAKRLILTSQVGYDSSVSKVVQVGKYQPILLHLYTHAPGISLLWGKTVWVITWQYPK